MCPHEHEEAKGHLVQKSVLSFHLVGARLQTQKSSGSRQVPLSTELSGQPLGNAKEALLQSTETLKSSRWGTSSHKWHTPFLSKEIVIVTSSSLWGHPL